MILKVVFYILLLSILGAALYFLYINISDLYATPISLIQNKPIDASQPSYNGSLQFYPGMRFASKEISYTIDNACGTEKTDRILSAFKLLENKTNELYFYQKEDGDINISCELTDEKEIPGKFYKVGEGGPTSIINTSLFYVIERGKMLLFYKENEKNCNKNNFNIELHELLHVLGFEHSQNTGSIMYSVSECNQVLTNDIAEELKKLYSAEELPDLYFRNVSAVKQGTYLNFTAEVDNRGLKKADAVSLNLYDNENNFYSYSLGSIDYGEGKIVWGITKLPGRNTDNIRFVIEDGKELDTGNNIITMSETL